MPREYLRKRWRELYENYLSNVRFECKRIGELFRYGTESGHKLRSGLVIIGCEAVGGDYKKVWPAAAAVEVLHKSTLIHDDLVDEDKARRGLRTFHRKYGKNVAIIGGDLISATAFKLLNDLEKDFDESTVLKCYELLSDTYRKIYQGQIMDLLFEERDNVTEKECIDMIKHKTAAIMESALKIGAILGGGSKDEVEMLSALGRHFGLAFQIQNDVNNLLIEDEVGRKRGSDIHQGKRTYVIVMALQNGLDHERGILLSALNKKKCSDKEVHEIIEMLKKRGSIDNAMSIAKEYANKAKNDIKNLKESNTKKLLLKLVDYIVSKTYWKLHANNG